MAKPKPKPKGTFSDIASASGLLAAQAGLKPKPQEKINPRGKKFHTVSPVTGERRSGNAPKPKPKPKPAPTRGRFEDTISFNEEDFDFVTPRPPTQIGTMKGRWIKVDDKGNIYERTDEPNRLNPDKPFYRPTFETTNKPAGEYMDFGPSIPLRVYSLF